MIMLKSFSVIIFVILKSWAQPILVIPPSNLHCHTTDLFLLSFWSWTENPMHIILLLCVFFNHIAAKFDIFLYQRSKAVCFLHLLLTIRYRTKGHSLASPQTKNMSNCVLFIFLCMRLDPCFLLPLFCPKKIGWSFFSEPFMQFILIMFMFLFHLFFCYIL